MDFLLIGESKIKIVLDRTEAEEYSLAGQKADISSHNARRVFWRILDMARSRVGFDPAGDKVLIQLYPTGEGGCEIFVTKLGILSDSSARLVSRSDRVTLLSRGRGIYAFESLEDLTSAVRAVSALSGDSPPGSDVYTDGRCYYLAIEEYGKGGEPIEYPCILEYGISLPPDSFVYICEHAKCLTEGNGVERFSNI